MVFPLWELSVVVLAHSCLPPLCLRWNAGSTDRSSKECSGCFLGSCFHVLIALKIIASVIKKKKRKRKDKKLWSEGEINLLDNGADCIALSQAKWVLEQHSPPPLPCIWPDVYRATEPTHLCWQTSVLTCISHPCSHYGSPDDRLMHLQSGPVVSDWDSIANMVQSWTTQIPLSVISTNRSCQSEFWSLHLRCILHKIHKHKTNIFKKILLVCLFVLLSGLHCTTNYSLKWIPVYK